MYHKISALLLLLATVVSADEANLRGGGQEQRRTQFRLQLSGRETRPNEGGRPGNPNTPVVFGPQILTITPRPMVLDGTPPRDSAVVIVDPNSTPARENNGGNGGSPANPIKGLPSSPNSVTPLTAKSGSASNPTAALSSALTGRPGVIVRNGN